VSDDRLATLLAEIRDNQREMLERQRAQLELAQRHLEQGKTQIEESLKLQREAVGRTRTIARIALPAILACIAAIVYLMLRYF
jgi:t-SNARE complex subunit (syntaxin)